jgi:hypothetical protein
MKKRLLSVILTRKSRDSGPFSCVTERHPWLQLIDAINVLDSKFLKWPNMRVDATGSEVESYKHIDFVFPKCDGRVVVALARSEYGEYILRRSLAWVDISEITFYTQGH